MVGEEGDHRVVGRIDGVDGIEHPSELVVHPGDHPVVDRRDLGVVISGQVAPAVDLPVGVDEPGLPNGRVRGQRRRHRRPVEE